jgi:hypothetical protein
LLRLVCNVCRRKSLCASAVRLPQKQIWPEPATRAILFCVGVQARRRGRHRTSVLQCCQVSPGGPSAAECTPLPAFAADARRLRTCLRVTNPQAAKPAVRSRYRTFKEPQRPGPTSEPSGKSNPRRTAGNRWPFLRRSGRTLMTSHVCIACTLRLPEMERNGKSWLFCAETVGMYLFLWKLMENLRNALLLSPSRTADRAKIRVET